MNPSASSSCNYKFKEIETLVNDEKYDVPIKFIALTETWLEPHISDAQIHIDSFNISRCDRADRIGGGVLLYSHVKIPVFSSFNYDDGICECLFTKFILPKLAIFIIYRPPNASRESFLNLIKFLRNCVEKEVDSSFQLCLTGDLNFPFIDWDEEKVKSGQTTEMQLSAGDFLNLINSLMMNQYISEPTRGNNILDLFCTNDANLIQVVKVERTEISDHHIITVILSLVTNSSNEILMHKRTVEGFSALNFFKADFNAISNAISAIDWLNLQQSCSFEEFPALFTSTLLEICSDLVPPKKPKVGSPKKAHALRRKKKRLKSRLEKAICNGSLNEIASLERKLSLLHYEIKQLYKNQRNEQESRAIEKIKSNPKFFYAYAKSHSSIRSEITMIQDSQGIMHTNSKSIADILQRQFSSVYSDPSSCDIQFPNFSSPNIDFGMTEESLTFSKEDIVAAISEIKSNAAPGPDEIPAMLLKNCAQSIAIPIGLIWQASMSSGVVPAYYKSSIVCPLHKKDDKVTPGNYRPISLTSHVIKVHERILRKVIVQFLENNKILTKNQHGFRSGRSTLTQLLAHFDDILNGLCQNRDSDSIYLDYAKAFDKVDHNLLVDKLLRYKCHHKLVN